MLRHRLQQTLRVSRSRGRKALEWVEARLIEIERNRRLAGQWTLSASRFTTIHNRTWWNTHDWSTLGEEWTPSPAWKADVLHRFMEPFIPVAGVVLEIGPGAGRWTEGLQRRAGVAYVVDVAVCPLTLCRRRFSTCPNVVCILTDGRSIPLRDGTVDGIWSYDVFVHVNPTDARFYFSDIGRVLRRGEYAVIHHPGHTSTRQPKEAHRSDLTDGMILDFAGRNGLEVVLQSTDLVNVGDALTVVRTPATENR
jgi:SAM-dependent methyltransferase